MAHEPMIATSAVDLSVDEDEVQYPTHVRVDDEALYVDIHVGDRVYGTMVTLESLNALMLITANQDPLAPFGAPPAGRELLN